MKLAFVLAAAHAKSGPIDRIHLLLAVLDSEVHADDLPREVRDALAALPEGEEIRYPEGDAMGPKILRALGVNTDRLRTRALERIQ